MFPDFHLAEDEILPLVLPELDAIEALDLPDSDGEPMENERERIQIDLVLDMLDYHWRDRDDFYAAGNMFLYYTGEQARAIIKAIHSPGRLRRLFRGPDIFIVLNVDGSYRRQKWVVWEEEGHYPNVIIELLSPTTRKVDLGSKKGIYQDIFRTPEYFCFDYLDPTGEESFVGWRLNGNGKYQPLRPNERGWLWSEELKLWLGLWDGSLLRDETQWLRFYTPQGDLVLTRSEAVAQRAEAEAQRAQTEAQRAEAETQRAEAEAQRANQEAERAERLAAKLRALGINPDA